MSHLFRPIFHPTLLALAASLILIIPKPAVAADVDVVWTDLVGVNATGNNLVKWTTNSYVASAISTDSYNSDAGIKFTTTSTSHTTYFGMVYNTTSTGNFPYSIYIKPDATIQIWEGTLKGNFGTFTAGDTLEISRSGTTVKYFKNSSEIYESTVSSTGTFWFDISMNYQNTAIADAQWTNVSAQAPAVITDLAVDPQDQSVDLTWTAPHDNGASITGYEVQYGTITSGTFGSTYSDDSSAGATVTGLTNDEAYQFRVVATNSVGTSVSSNEVLETAGERTSITWKDVTGLSINGDVLTQTATTGWDNAGAFSTTSYGSDVGLEFPRGPSYDYMVGFSLINVDNDWDTIDFGINIKETSMYVIENGDFSNYNTTAAEGDTFQIKRSGSTVKYYKNHELVYTSTYSGIGSLSVDVASYWNGGIIQDVELMNVANYTATVPGHIIDLSVEPIDGGVTLDWTAPGDSGSAITEYEVQYGTITSGTFGSTYTDNAFPGATITGLTNDTGYQFRVVATNSVGTGDLSNVVYETPGVRTDVVWTDLTGLSLSGTTLTKTSTTGFGYDAGAISNTSYSGDVAVDFPRTDQWEHVVGLTYSDANYRWGPMDYSLYVSDDDVYVIESGTNITSTSIAEGDTLQIKRNGTTVTYYKNHESFYTSSTSSSGNLYVDTWIYWNGGQVSDVELFNISGVPEVTSVSHTPVQIDPADSDTTTISFTLSEDADVTIDIYSAHYDSVSDSYSRTYEDTVLSSDARSAGSNTFVWDGKDSGSGDLANGVYVYKITATGTFGSFSYDPVYFLGTVTIDNTNFTPSSFDPYRGEVATATFDLSDPAWVRSWIGKILPGWPDRMLVNWDAFPDGTNTVIWDGRDEDGDFLPEYINTYYPSLGGYHIYHWSRILPVNAVIVSNYNAVAVDQVYADPIAFYPKYGEITDITYGIAEDADVTVTLINSQGSPVRVLVDDQATFAGNHTVEWDGLDDSGDTVSDTGIYTIQVEATVGTTTKTLSGTVSVF